MGLRMNWITLALISAIAFSAYAVIQKYAFQKHSINVYAFGLLGGVVHLTIGTPYWPPIHCLRAGLPFRS